MAADRYINLSDSESRALSAGASVLLVPMKPQPRVGLRGDGTPVGNGYMVWDSPKGATIPMTRTAMFRIETHAPFAPGDVLNGREAWRICPYCRVWNYRADGPDGAGVWHCKACDETFGSKGWSLAQHCGHRVRHKYRITSVSAIRVSEIGEEDAERCIAFDHIERAGNRFTAVEVLADRWHQRWPKLPWESAWAWRMEVKR